MLRPTVSCSFHLRRQLLCLMLKSDRAHGRRGLSSALTGLRAALKPAGQPGSRACRRRAGCPPPAAGRRRAPAPPTTRSAAAPASARRSTAATASPAGPHSSGAAAITRGPSAASRPTQGPAGGRDPPSGGSRGPDRLCAQPGLLPASPVLPGAAGSLWRRGPLLKPRRCSVSRCTAGGFAARQQWDLPRK